MTAATSDMLPRPVLLTALRRRNPAFDGLTWAAVRSSRIVCRMTCPAGPALARNVTFYRRLADARRDGYRPCKRCRPEERRGERAWVTALLERHGAPIAPAGRAALTAGRVDTPLGAMLAIAGAGGLLLLEFADRPMLRTQLQRLVRHTRQPIGTGTHPALAQARRELAEWFAGRRRDFEVAVAVRGSAFQQAAWAALRTIPYGTTVSYEQQARRAGRPGAARAVGRANGDNGVAIVTPCHRVVGANGALTGYGGGVWRKRWLLDHEAAVSARGDAASD